MEYFIHLTHAYGKMIFAISYAAAALFLLTAGIISGKKQSYPMSQWLLILGSGLLFFIIGNKLFTYSLADLERIIGMDSPAGHAGKTVMGGILGMFVGIGLAKLVLGFRLPVLDRIAVSFPIAMAIHRVGCLFSGCCHGITTELSWGIAYGQGSLAYQSQLLSGDIKPDSLVSLGVHPTQLYQIIGCLLIAYMIWRIKDRFKPHHGLFLASLLLYLCLRFITEFFRNPLANGSFGTYHYGLKLAQWAVLGAILITLFLIYFKRKRAFAFPEFRIKIPEILREMLLTVFLLVLIFMLSRWFDIIEISVLGIYFFPLGIIVGIKAYKSITVPKLRIIPVLLIIAFISLTGQTVIRTDDTRYSFLDLKVSATAGYFEHFLNKYSHAGGDCYNRYPQYNTQHTYIVNGASISYNEHKGRFNKFRIGTNLSLGFEIENKDSAANTTYFLGAVSPFFEADHRWFGVGFGFMLGNIRFEGIQDDVEDGDNEIKTKAFNFMFNARLGPYDYFYLTGKRAYLLPTQMPKPLWQFGAGTGLGKVDGRNIEGGITINGDDPGGYLMATIPFKKIFEAGFYCGLDKDEYTAAWQYQVALQFRYKFKFRDLPEKEKKTEPKYKYIEY